MDDSPRNSEEYRRGHLPVWLYMTISILWSVAAFIGAAIANVEISYRFHISGEWPRLAVFFGMIFIAVIVPEFVMFKWLPARCSKCGGRCWAVRPRGNETLKFNCENCGKMVDTGMRGGDT